MGDLGERLGGRRPARAKAIVISGGIVKRFDRPIAPRDYGCVDGEHECLARSRTRAHGRRGRR